MKYNKLGKTDLSVSLMGVGAIPLQRFDEENALSILHEALNLNINFVDTARGYTVSEELIGSALSKLGRDKFVIATKSMKRDYAGMKADIEVSLKNLRSDYIDLYQCHFVTTAQELEKIISQDGALKALLEAKKNGKIRHFGITSHNNNTIISAIDSQIFETVQYPFSFIETDGLEVFERAKKYEMGTIAMKPLGGGAIRNIGLSLRYIASRGVVDTLIPGVDDEVQLRTNAEPFLSEIKPLSEFENRIIMQEKEVIGREFCRRCDYCQPCPAKIPISLIFNAYAYYQRYHLVDWAKDKYKACEKNIMDCIDCGACEQKCPYNLPVRDLLRRSHDILI